ncbi:AMP-binding protein [Nocardia gipuzkoensis]
MNARAVTPALGATLRQVFGMAEGLLNYARLDDAAEPLHTTWGRALSPADEIRVVDADGNDVEPGAEGELLTRDLHTIRGYYRAPEHQRPRLPPTGPAAARLGAQAAEWSPGGPRPDRGRHQPRRRECLLRRVGGAPARASGRPVRRCRAAESVARRKGRRGNGCRRPDARRWPRSRPSAPTADWLP